MRDVKGTSSDIRTALVQAHLDRCAVRVRGVTAGGRPIDMEGRVTAVRSDGEIRFHTGDSESGSVYDLPAGAVIEVERVRGLG